MNTQKPDDIRKKELADKDFETLWAILKQLDRQAQRKGQTEGGMREEVLLKEFPEIYERYSAGGMSAIRRKPAN